MTTHLTSDSPEGRPRRFSSRDSTTSLPPLLGKPALPGSLGRFRIAEHVQLLLVVGKLAKSARREGELAVERPQTAVGSANSANALARRRTYVSEAEVRGRTVVPGQAQVPTSGIRQGRERYTRACVRARERERESERRRENKIKRDRERDRGREREAVRTGWCGPRGGHGVSEVGSARKRGLRALLSVRSPVPSCHRLYSCLLLARPYASCVYATMRKVEGEREWTKERDWLWETNREGEKREWEGGGRQKVTVACRRVLDVASGRSAWPVTRGPWPGLRPRWSVPPPEDRWRKREKGTARLEGLTRSRREREREDSPGGGRSLSYCYFYLAFSSSKLLRRVSASFTFSRSLSAFRSRTRVRDSLLFPSEIVTPKFTWILCKYIFLHHNLCTLPLICTSTSIFNQICY